MRILGIDPGLNTTGYGVIDAQGQRLGYQASGAIRIPKGTLPERLKTLFDGVSEVARQAGAEVAVVEIVFVNVNPQSTLLLGQARGAAIAALVAQGLPVVEYTALQLKKSIVGYGRASKSQIQEMVMRLLALPGQPGPDAADALGLAICHAHAQRGLAALHRASPTAGLSTADVASGKLSAAQLRGMRVRGGRLIG
ncbi:Crossover junction endodeoxyribonuclease RuvC [Thiomonas arsenitoxydans]|nr:crossover junction endodeoxyribonuclease RuvC [Thiomonas arsenitoxydans]CAZ89855.1 Crossover junction endodeoxyribonuclease ruvC (Holliday junction nuclease ruvC) (Holliday juction resolvase ruvC) [Thiomonas arsenitoxydans]CQR38956.1 Crossover junction endodeoxyribonuclease RuvC [Thiomonas arsenitoxydans]CQR39611.1 Crossover junction endodeoxyribonuclease RuvC [Thiomonas arsenitoxydans]CQR39806.1 Crossover junction endodeoxyribonuclease RuvC [Thiomonas arsenitoxydans]